MGPLNVQDSSHRSDRHVSALQTETGRESPGFARAKALRDGKRPVARALSLAKVHQPWPIGFKGITLSKLGCRLQMQSPGEFFRQSFPMSSSAALPSFFVRLISFPF